MVKPPEWPSTRETLIGRLREEGREPDWDLFVEVYGPLIFRFCRRRSVQDADARDVTQNVFLAVRRGIKRFHYDPERGKFRSWLGTVAAREITRHQKDARRAGQPTASPAPAAEHDATWIVEFNSHVYQWALDRIRPRFDESTWQAFELLWLKDHSAAEVARKFKKTPDWVYQVKFRVLRRL
jgi:RNA polymerase sigma-70 factor (ECF subfamily)